MHPTAYAVRLDHASRHQDKYDNKQQDGHAYSKSQCLNYFLGRAIVFWLNEMKKRRTQTDYNYQKNGDYNNFDHY
jgi:hypothetical protein